MATVFQLLLFAVLILETRSLFGGKLTFTKDGLKFSFNKKKAEKKFLTERKLNDFREYVREYWQPGWQQQRKGLKKEFPGTKFSKKALNRWDEMHKYVRPPTGKAGRTRRRRRRRKCTKKMRRRGRCKRELSVPFLSNKADTLRREKRQTCPQIPSPPFLQRKEWRRLTNAERNSFISAFNSLATTDFPGMVDLTEHQMLVTQHRQTNSPSAHDGAGFLPWHREFLWRFSNMMRSRGYIGAIPYWDNRLDIHLPNPADSAMFTPTDFGVSSGLVTAPWTVEAIPACEKQNSLELRRDMFTHSNAHALMMDDGIIETILNKTCFQHLTKGWDSDTEDTYDRILLLMGSTNNAHMSDPNCAPTDPLYWLHSTFMDYIWERYRSNQGFGGREIEYPLTQLVDPVSTVPQGKHRWKAKMRPFFGLINAHGMSNHYTSYYYHYEQSPAEISNCQNDGDCGYKLWCSNGICISKIRLNGHCAPGWSENQCDCPGTSTPHCNNSTLACQCI